MSDVTVFVVLERWNGFGLFERFERKEMRACIYLIGLLFLKDPRFAYHQE
jgi:hypothetical protein